MYSTFMNNEDKIWNVINYFNILLNYKKKTYFEMFITLMAKHMIQCRKSIIDNK